MKRAHRVMVLGGIVAASIGATSVAFGSGNGTSSPSALVTMVPCRLLDTRPGTGQRRAAGNPHSPPKARTPRRVGHERTVHDPPSATAISANVTAVNGSSDSYLTLYPADVDRPLSSNLNWVHGAAPVPNKVDVKLSSDGKVSIYNLAGNVDVVVDIVGYYEPAPVGAGDKGDFRASLASIGVSGSAGLKGDPRGHSGSPGSPRAGL